MSRFGFKTRAFGFSKADVNDYLERTQRDFSAKEAVLNERITAITAALDAEKAQTEALSAEMESLRGKLHYYNGKEAEIEKMSVSIGTMYLVAQQNAAEVIEAAERYAKDIAEQSKRELAAAMEAGEQLGDIKIQVNGIADKFSEEINVLTASLFETRSKLEAQIDQLAHRRSEVILTLEDTDNA